MKVIVVGGGVLGAMHALWAHDLGHEVLHIEREPAARGASVRNFGLVWVGGRACGDELMLAQAARDLWAELAARIPAVGFEAVGSLTIARTDDELVVLKDAAAATGAAPKQLEVLDASEVRLRNPALRGDYLGGLYCGRDARVEPRQVPGAIRDHLLGSSRYTWLPDTEVVEVRAHSVRDGYHVWHHGELVVCCTGAAHRGIASAAVNGPAHALRRGPLPLRRVRLQMLQTAPASFELTTAVADGDSLRYYPAYDLPSRRRLAPQDPTGAAWASQLLMVQRADGALTIGDTHAYDEPFAFDVQEGPYEHLRATAEKLLGQPLPPTERRWAGVYSETTDGRPYHRSALAPGVILVTGPGGKGMTCSPAIAAETFGGDAMSAITLVIADMAGTTIADDGVVLDAFEAALAAAGIAPGSAHYARAQEIVRETMGQSKIAVFRLILDTDVAAEAANAAFESAFADLVTGGRVKPIPGTEEAFAELRSRGCKIALTTGFSAPTRDVLLKHLDWRDEVDLALSPTDAVRGRPHPDLIWAAMLSLGAAAVTEVAVVGDTASDMESALRAGVAFRCGVLTGADDSRRLRSGGATHVLASFADLLHLF